MPSPKNFLSEIFLFKEIESKEFDEIVKSLSYEIRQYKAKEIIYSPDSYENKVGFVIKGECSVIKSKNNGASVPLNTLKPGDSFGIMAVLSKQKEFPTTILAKRNSTVLFLTMNDTLELIKSHSSVAMNAIAFLIDRIGFLNNKIATFASDGVESKLTNYLMLQYKKHGKLEFSFNAQKTAAELNVGRASLYRAMSSLNEEGIIQYESKKIIIADLSLLEKRL